MPMIALQLLIAVLASLLIGRELGKSSPRPWFVGIHLAAIVMAAIIILDKL